MIPRWVPAVAVVVAVVVAVAGCGGSDDPATPSATVDSTPSTERSTTTEARTPEQEVEAAYLRSWEVYAKAVRELDAGGLSESYADDALTTVQAEVERLLRTNTPIKVAIDHGYDVQLVDVARAVVVDSYVNHSVYVDPSTGEPTEPDPNEEIIETYTLVSVESVWKVIGIVRR